MLGEFTNERFVAVSVRPNCFVGCPEDPVAVFVMRACPHLAAVGLVLNFRE